MATPNREQLYKMAINAAKSGQKRGARLMFQQILAEDPKNISVLLWMARLSNSVEERRSYLERVLKINPNNDVARRAMSKIDTRDTAQRNKNLLRIGTVSYVSVVLLLAVFYILWLAGLPPV